LVEIYNHYKERGFTVLAIETTNRPQLAKEFTTSVGATFPIVLDDSDTSDKLFGVTATPTNLLIDRRGRIFFKTIGYGPGMENGLVAQVEYLLNRT
jgi:peroxiredoxin